jgi:hypothetical protein
MSIACDHLPVPSFSLPGIQNEWAKKIIRVFYYDQQDGGSDLKTV